MSEGKEELSSSRKNLIEENSSSLNGKNKNQSIRLEEKVNLNKKRDPSPTKNNKNAILKEASNKKHNNKSKNKRGNKNENINQIKDIELIESISINNKTKEHKKKEDNNFIIKLIKTANEIEKYNSVYSSKYCGICGINMIHQKETLRFKNSREFLYYLQYLFTCIPDIITYNKENVAKNKKDVFKYFSNYRFSSEKWKFYNHKFLCKCCLLKQINLPNCLNYFISIFVDNKKKKESKDNFPFTVNKGNEKVKEKKTIKNINEKKNSNDILFDEDLNKDIIIDINNDTEKTSENIFENNQSENLNKITSNTQNSQKDNLESPNSNKNLNINFTNNFSIFSDSFSNKNLLNRDTALLFEIKNYYNFSINKLSQIFFEFLIYFNYSNYLNKTRSHGDKNKIIYTVILFHFKDKIINQIHNLELIQNKIKICYKNFLNSFNQCSNEYLSTFQKLTDEFDENFQTFQNKTNNFIEDINNYYNSLKD